MSKRVIEPNTTLYPVPVVLITAGGDTPDVMTCNRIASCSAEPPRLSISVRPVRYSHTLIQQTGEFVVNIPTPAQRTLTDYVGVVTGREEDKIAIAGLELTPALKVKTPLLADCLSTSSAASNAKSNWALIRCSLAGCRQYTWTNRSWTSGGWAWFGLSIPILNSIWAIRQRNWRSNCGLGLVAVKAAAAEETALVEKFGEAYRVYRQRTGRFLPRIRR